MEPSGPRTLSEQFYAWEVRGRGWQVWPYPVPLEPPFLPFIGYQAPHARHESDDGQRPTMLSRLANQVRALTAPAPALDTSDSLVTYHVEPTPSWNTEPIVELQVVLSPDTVVTAEIAEQFLLGLTACRDPISFEVMGSEGRITVQFTCRLSDTSTVRGLLLSYFPTIAVHETEKWLEGVWSDLSDGPPVVVDFGLSNETMLPLLPSKRFAIDPLIGIAGALSELGSGDLGILQVLFQRARAPWTESMRRVVDDGSGNSLFADAPDLVAQTVEKVSRPLFAAVVRAIARSRDERQAWEIVRRIGASLVAVANPLGNELVPLTNDYYDEAAHAESVLTRQTYRSGMLISSAELASLVHPPSEAVRAEEVDRRALRTKAVPESARGNAFALGTNHHRGRAQEVTLSAAQRTRHTYVLGASGTGKSTLLLNLIRQDMESGNGIAVLDPHGDLIDYVLAVVPEKRRGDVLLFDPADESWPVGFNILSARSDLEKTVLSSDLVSVFMRLSTSWGDQMTSVLGNAVLAFLESEQGGTLHDLKRFLVEPKYRTAFLRTVMDPDVVYYWQSEFPLLTGRPQGPILTRLDTFLRPKLIRNMVSQRENQIDFRAVMDDRRILLARLSQGAIGEENAALLGTLLVSKLHQAALGRQNVSEAERPDFFLTIDEFQHFITPSMASILSGARKYHLGLTLAHQDFRQLWNHDTAVASAVLTNPYTRICFRLGDFDAKKLADGFSGFTASDLLNLSVGEAIARVERNEYDFNLRTHPLPVLDPVAADRSRAAIQALSRARYARSRSEVEMELRAHLTMEPPATSSPAATVIASKPKASSKPKPTTRNNLPAPAVPPEVPAPSQPPVPNPEPNTTRQHVYLQQLIRKMAEHVGYRVTIEQPVLSGTGRVDVSLERDGYRIACEISVTSTDQYELQNIQKCLAAGYDEVLVVATDKRSLRKIEERVQRELSADSQALVRFVLPEELPPVFTAPATAPTMTPHETSTKATIKGYKVNVRYEPLPQTEQRARKEAISQVLLNAMKRLKE